MFHHPVRGREAKVQLLDFRQGTQSVADYSITFRIVAAQSGYGDRALCGLFRHRLNSLLKDELATRDDSSNLEELIDIALILDNRMRATGSAEVDGFHPGMLRSEGLPTKLPGQLDPKTTPVHGIRPPGTSRCSWEADSWDRRRDGVGSTTGPVSTTANEGIGTPIAR